MFLFCRTEGDYDSTEEDWMSGVGDHYAAIATHDFKGRDSHELTFSKGHTLRVAPKNLQPPNVAPGWLLAVNSTDGGRPDSLYNASIQLSNLQSWQISVSEGLAMPSQ